MFAFLKIVAALMLTQAAPANAACSALTPAQVSSLIGTAAALPITASATESTCMYQNNDRVITVLTATAVSADGARGLFDAKKRIVSGADVTGWSVPAYSGFIRPVAVVGVLRNQTLTEVKAVDPAQTAEALRAKLQAVMKDVAAGK
jgi:hypothetical protein